MKRQTVFVITLLLFAGTMLLATYFAYADHFLTPRAMQARGFHQGIPYLAYGGAWFDLFILSPVLACVVSRYGRAWTRAQITGAAIASFFGTLALHVFVYVRNPLPGAHSYNDALTAAGWVHALYMWAGLTIFTLFYCCTRHQRTQLRAVWWMNIALFVHVIVATHVPLRLYAQYARPDWYPALPAFDAHAVYTIGGVLVLLLILTYVAIRRSVGPSPIRDELLSPA
jgi:hypothetical protein